MVAKIVALTGGHFVEVLFGCELQFVACFATDAPFF